MKVFKGVRSSAKKVPTVHVDKDTVYVRTDIVEVEEEDFEGFEYDEIQYTMKEYMENLALSEDIDSMSAIITMLVSKVMDIENRVKTLEGGSK